MHPRRFIAIGDQCDDLCVCSCLVISLLPLHLSSYRPLALSYRHEEKEEWRGFRGADAGLCCVMSFNIRGYLTISTAGEVYGCPRIDIVTVSISVPKLGYMDSPCCLFGPPVASAVNHGPVTSQENKLRLSGQGSWM